MMKLLTLGTENGDRPTWYCREKEDGQVIAGLHLDAERDVAIPLQPTEEDIAYLSALEDAARELRLKLKLAYHRTERRAQDHE